MNQNFSADSMAQMVKANASLFKKMYELSCVQQLSALEKAHEALLSSQQDFSQSMTEALNSGDGNSMAKMMASMPLWAMRAQMRQGQKAMELNSHAFEQLGQPMREAITDWQKELNLAMQGKSDGLGALQKD
jgi:gamma-glutamyl phosphate reductase